jgi:hypothetical protein
MSFLALVTLKRPFDNINNELQLPAKVEKGERPPRPDKMHCVDDASSENVWKLLEEMWSHGPGGPEARPSAEEVKRRIGEITLAMYSG